MYSKNRAFRLYLSSKAGKTAVLQPTGEVLLQVQAVMVLMAACAGQPVPADPPSSAHSACYRAGRLQPAVGCAPQRTTFMASLICNVPPDVQLLRCSQPQGGCSPAWQRVRQQPPGRRHSSTGSSSLHAGQPPSPLPAVDTFLAAVCTHVWHCWPLKCHEHVPYNDVDISLTTMRSCWQLDS